MGDNHGTLKIVLLVLLCWVWIPVIFFIECFIRPLIMMILQIAKSCKNILKLLLLIVITVFLFEILAFLFFINGCIVVPQNVKNFYEGDGFDFKKLFWEDENKMQKALDKFFDKMLGGENGREGEGGKYQDLGGN
mmetsp:Transcript_12329/g.10629  ORF Transcript_12329/g.10629 Transcript_12329/m.10629 type:complete len:135 (+) Transcript_12329:63-467(+)